MFSHFSLHRLLIKSLREMGLRQPSPVQEAAIPLAMDGIDLLVTAETGSGKTVAYLAPALHLLMTTANHGSGPRLLILLPTRELAQQVYKDVQALIVHTRLSVGLITGGEEVEPQQQLLDEETQIIVATTGRLLAAVEAEALDLSTLDVLVLDEADRMLDMGFSEDVAKIAAVANPERQTLMFSATMNGPWMKSLANKLLREPEELKVSGGRAAHSQIREQVMLADHQGHKQKLLLWLLGFEKYEKAMVFTNSREKAELLSQFLQQKKHRVASLHGDVTAERRKRVMELVENDEIKTLVATDVAARGLDIDGVDLVINFDMPRRGDDYVHRIGRTGRGGKEGVAITLVQPNEWNLKASVERYLKHDFEPRVIEALQGEFNGPEKVRASGKAWGTKKKKDKDQRLTAKARKRKKEKKAKSKAKAEKAKQKRSTKVDKE